MAAIVTRGRYFGNRLAPVAGETIDGVQRVHADLTARIGHYAGRGAGRGLILFATMEGNEEYAVDGQPGIRLNAQIGQAVVKKLLEVGTNRVWTRYGAPYRSDDPNGTPEDPANGGRATVLDINVPEDCHQLVFFKGSDNELDLAGYVVRIDGYSLAMLAAGAEGFIEEPTRAPAPTATQQTAYAVFGDEETPVQQVKAPRRKAALEI